MVALVIHSDSASTLTITDLLTDLRNALSFTRIVMFLVNLANTTALYKGSYL